MVGFLNWCESRTLCTYMWKVVWAVTLVGLLIPMTVIGMLLDFYGFFWVTQAAEDPSSLATLTTMLFENLGTFFGIFLSICMFFGMLGWMIVGALVFVFLLTLVWERQYDDNIVTEWYRATKNKYCPVIKYIND